MEDKNLKVYSLLFLANFQENWCQNNNSSQCSTTQLSLRFQVAMQTTLLKPLLMSFLSIFLWKLHIARKSSSEYLGGQPCTTH